MSIGVIIRLQNLPWSANSFDIRQFFKGLSIPEGGVHIVGGELGDAFIAFSSDEDARQAMMLSGSKLKEVQVSLLLSSRSEMQKVIEKARSASTQQTLTLPSAPVQQKQEEPKTLKRSRSRSRSRSNRRDDRDRDRDRGRRRSRSRDRSRRRSRSRSRGRYHKDDDSRDMFRKAEEPNKPDQASNGNLGGFVANAAFDPTFPRLAGNALNLLQAQLPFFDDQFTANVRNTLSVLGALPQLPLTDSAALATAASRFSADPRGRRDISPKRGNISETTPVFPPFVEQFNQKLGPAFAKRPNDPSQVWLTQPQQVANIAPVLPILHGNINAFQERQNDNLRSRFNDNERDFNNFASDRRFTIDRDSRPSYQRPPRNDIPRSRFPESRSRFADNDRKNEYRDDERLRKNDIGLCVELENCPPTTFKEIERSFAGHDVVIDDVRFSGSGRDRRVGVKVMGRMSKVAALQISGLLKIDDKVVGIHDLPENEFFSFRCFRDPNLEVERRKSGDGPRPPMRRRFDKGPTENGNNSNHVLQEPEEKKKTDDPPATSSDCVFISSLPASISDRDLIDFFSDIGLTPKKIHLMFDDNREPMGQAYVEFHTAAHAQQACEKNGAPMGRFTVDVKLASRKEMNAARNSDRQDESIPKQALLNHQPLVPLMQQPTMAPLLNRPIYPLIRGGNRGRGFGQRPLRPNMSSQDLPPLPPLPEPDRVVTMSNIPYRASIDDILNFFGDSYDITPDDVFRKLNDRNQPTSDARIVMRTAEDATRAVNMLNNTKIWERAITLRLLKHEME